MTSTVRRMTGRDRAESHRVSTPLELLFDLTFVVAVSQAAAALSHALEAGHVRHAVTGYLLIFFAIWWAWMNFTWFASAYDIDDVRYRLLTLVQMAGALVLAAGVPAAFDGDYRGVTSGYVVMRVAMIAQWLRAAAADEQRRSTARRYALGIAVVQAGWVARLAPPTSWGVVSFLLLGVAELCVPLWAERSGTTPWHPHHVAERYGLFTIIVLGESVLASTVALQVTVQAAGWDVERTALGVGALALLFLLWWIYFLEPAGKKLERKPDLVWVWGYGHYAVFAALAAVGSALEAAAAGLGDHDGPHASHVVLAFAVAVPVVVFLLVTSALHAPLDTSASSRSAAVAATCVGLLVVAALPAVGLPLGWCVLLLCVPVAALTAGVSGAASKHRRALEPEAGATTAVS